MPSIDRIAWNVCRLKNAVEIQVTYLSITCVPKTAVKPFRLRKVKVPHLGAAAVVVVVGSSTACLRPLMIGARIKVTDSVFALLTF